MATPMTSTQQIAMFNRWGIPFKEYKDWKNHNRNHKGLWGPVNGLMVHHTGSDAPDQRETLYSGLQALPGPLSQWGLDQKGVIHCIGNGRCNHAGLGDPDVLNAVIAENYGDDPPVDNETLVDGNARFYGVEIWYSGSHEMTDAQYTTLMKLGAGITEFHKWSVKSIIGHGEWQPGKWDPGYKSGTMMDMSNMRKDISATKKLGPKPIVKPPTTPTPPPPVAKPTKDEVIKDIAYIRGQLAKVEAKIKLL